jgi:predicted transcriptional regulator
MSTVKDEVRKLAEQLSDSATWDEVMYEVYVRQKIADGEMAIAEGRILPHDEVKKRSLRHEGRLVRAGCRRPLGHP